MSSTWTNWLWDATEDIYEAILEHPFLAGLTSGELSAERFEYHVTQSAHQLRDQVRTMAVVAAKAPSHDSAGLLAGYAADTAAVVHVLTETLLPKLHIDAAAVEDVKPSPTTHAYATHLLATAHTGSFAEGLAALLPCYWMYQRVGAEIAAKGSPEPRYQLWIDTYGGDEFAATVENLIGVAGLIGPDLPGAEAWRSRGQFLTSARYEWMIWDAAWRLEAWPV